MLKRFKRLHEELRNRATALTDAGHDAAIYTDRADQIESWIESLENGWPIHTEFAGTCASEFEKMLGL
jgi:hypothetical protein